ncbi:hypothetical protein ABIC45_002976 [Mucilaginibacter rubeus]|uniref:hypothetical protein n=1 Tax=Mucilaginibacter rubeus TaxID=2027860 RepID=UPI0033945204
MALALTLGVAGAFATNSSAKNSKLLNPNWQTEDASGLTVPVASGGVYDPNRTKAQAQADFGCSGTQDICAGTVNAQDGAYNGSQRIQHN